MAEDKKGDDDPGFKVAGLAVDFISKILIGIAAVYFTYATYRNSVEARLDAQQAECTKNVSHLFDFVFEKAVSGDRVNELVHVLVKLHCEGYETKGNREKLVLTLNSLTSSGKPTPTPIPNPTPTPTPTASPTPRPSPTPTASPTPTPSSTPTPSPTPTPTASPSGADGSWVAVGFIGSPDFNFTKVDGGAIGASISSGSTIKAKWQVNVRRRPADWRSQLQILNTGDCFVVSETELLNAGDQKQLWANGKPEKCS